MNSAYASPNVNNLHDQPCIIYNPIYFLLTPAYFKLTRHHIILFINFSICFFKEL